MRFAFVPRGSHAPLLPANYRFSFVDCVGCVDFPCRGFTFTDADRFVWYGLAWSWLMVPRVEMLLDTLARIIRLIRNNRRHSGYDQIQKSRRGDESSLDLGCKIRRDVKETNIVSFFLFMYILRVVFKIFE